MKIRKRSGVLRMTLGGSLLALSFAVCSSPAAASVVVGQIAAPTNTCASPVDRVQPTVSIGNSYVIPANGTITSWSTTTATNGGQMKLKVFRPVVGNTFSVVGQTDPRDLALNTTNTFSANIAVKAGDVIGMNSFSGTPDCGTLVTGENYLRQPAATATPATGDLANGQSATFGGVVMDRHLDISAQLEPTNTVTFGQVARNKKKGTARVTLDLPNPGQLAFSGNKVKLAQVANSGVTTVTAPGSVTFSLKAKGKKLRKLKKTGKVGVNPAFTFTPNGGAANTQSIQVKLKRKR